MSAGLDGGPPSPVPVQWVVPFTPAIQITGRETRCLLEAARWAPSIHNSQPWLLRPLDDGIGVLEDRERALPVIDPRGHERTVSCGAALFNAKAALRALGHVTHVEILPDPADPLLVGTVRSTGHRTASPGDVTLHRMMFHRRTHRRLYRSHAIAEEDILDLRQVVACEGARLSVGDSSVRQDLADILRRAVHLQVDDLELRRETESWVRRDRTATDAVDGIPSAALGTSPYPVDSLIHADHLGIPETDEFLRELARSTMLVLWTEGDSREDWVLSGMALERLLLTATARGLVATFVDQALQDPVLRQEVAQILGIRGHPHVLFRLGRPLVTAPRSPRRPVEQLLD